MNRRIEIVAVFKRQITVAILIVVKYFFGQMKGIRSAFGTDDTTRNIIKGRVDTAPDP